MATSSSGQDTCKPNLPLWLTTWIGTIGVSCVLRLDYPLLPNPLLTNLIWSRRLNISLLLFVCFVFYLILVWKVQNKNLGLESAKQKHNNNNNNLDHIQCVSCYPMTKCQENKLLKVYAFFWIFHWPMDIMNPLNNWSYTYEDKIMTTLTIW